MNNKKGAALVTVIVVFAVLMILGVTVLSLSVTETKQVVYQEEKVKSFYVARSGADAMASYLIDNPDELDTVINKTKVKPATGQIDGRPFELFVTGTEEEFIIESIAYTRDGKEDERLYLTINEYDLLDHAIYAKQILDTGNNLKINGNIGTNSSSILFGSNLVNGNIVLGPNATQADIEDAQANTESDHMVIKLSKEIIFPPIKVTDFSSYLPDNITDIDTSVYGLTDGKLLASLNKIDIAGGNTFYVHGGGQVHLYIRDSITVSGDATVSTDPNTHLFIYYEKSDTITFNGGPNSNIVVYAPNARINYNGGGNNETIGAFICNLFDGPDSNATITKGSGSMNDLMVTGVAGYTRAIWSE